MQPGLNALERIAAALNMRPSEWVERIKRAAEETDERGTT